MSYTNDTYIKNTHKMEISDIKLHIGAIIGKTDKQVNLTGRTYRMIFILSVAKIKYMKGYSLIN